MRSTVDVVHFLAPSRRRFDPAANKTADAPVKLGMLVRVGFDIQTGRVTAH